MSFRTTAQVWAHLRPRLRGRWFRLEAIQPDGLPDLVGFWAGQTCWVEIKIFPDVLRPSQKIIIGDARSEGVTIWTVAAMGSRLSWYASPDALNAGAASRPDFLKLD